VNLVVAENSTAARMMKSIVKRCVY